MTAVTSLRPEQVEKPAHYPTPVGYRMLIKPYRREAVSKGGIVLASETQRNDELLEQCGQVLAMGPDCYRDREKFPTGPWCAVGDWVVFRRNAGATIRLRNPKTGEEEKILSINDDEVLQVTDAPDAVIAYA